MSLDKSSPFRSKNTFGAPTFFSTKWDPVSSLNTRSFSKNPKTPVQMANSKVHAPLNSRNSTTPKLTFQFDNQVLKQTSTLTEFTGKTQGKEPPDVDEAQVEKCNTGNFQYVPVRSMLERTYNVTTRDIIPQKRRKISDDRDHKQKNNLSNIESDDLSNEKIKEEKQEDIKICNPSETRPLHISLIDDDKDEGARSLSDSEMREVCYGRIEGAEIMAFKVPTPKPGAISISNDFWPQVRIVLRRRYGEKGNIIHAVDATRTIIGTVDVNTAIGLTPLLDSKYSIRTTSRVLTRARKENDSPPGSDINARYGLDLNLYGPKKHALGIGKHLSQKNLWLRTPLFVEAGVELYNPHCNRPPQPQRPTAILNTCHRQQATVRTTEEIRNDVIGMFDSLQRSENLPEMNPNYRITTKLLKHQKQGLYFMVHKEKPTSKSDGQINNTSLWREVYSINRQKMYINIITGQEERNVPKQVYGGILADMMGLGKTLLSLSLVVHTLDEEAQEWAKITPNLLLNEQSSAQERKGKRLLPKLGPTSLVLNAKTTLLISPLSIISNWEDQIKQHLKTDSLSYYIYHGAHRLRDSRKLAGFDLVITTYGSVASEFSHRSKSKSGSYPLEEINWFRIILDEAHMIREQSTQQFKAICRLAANRRWAVTGTPVQNRLDDLGALMKFLRIKPFDEKGGFAQYIMAPFKMCDPEILPKLRLLVDSITLRRLKDRIDLPPRHDRLVKLNFTEEEREIYDIFSQNASDRIKVIFGQSEKSLSGKSYVHILQSILRLRLICAHGKDLLNENDLKIINGLSKDSAIDLDSDGEDGTSCLTENQAYEMYSLMKETNTDVCLVCSVKVGPNDTVESDGNSKDEIFGHMTPCYHIICRSCFQKYESEIEEYAKGQSTINCPICQQLIKISYLPLLQNSVIHERQFRMRNKKMVKSSKYLKGYNGPHTKTKALLEDLNISRDMSEKLPIDSPIKSVVFSGWTAHLDLIQIALDENGFKYVRLDGKMNRTARGAAMDTFRNDPSVLVILVSISAGGLGLNLTTASKVYVMEPQYNPASESQAVDRVHRLGQTREVETKRYIMNNSFEEKILILQDKKKKLASLSMDSENRRIDKAEAARKRLEDLRSLFK